MEVVNASTPRDLTYLRIPRRSSQSLIPTVPTYSNILRIWKQSEIKDLATAIMAAELTSTKLNPESHIILVSYSAQNDELI